MLQTKICSAALFVAFWLVPLAAGSGSQAGAAEPVAAGSDQVFDDQALEFFEKQVRPLLVQRCYECHSAADQEPKGGLRVDSRAALLAGGDTGPAMAPGDPEESLLIDAINYGDLYEMPPKSKLPAEEIAVLTRWVEMGAPWPAEEGPGAQAAYEKFDLQALRDQHWAWQAVRPPQPPAVQNEAWAQSPIDHFILARLEQEGIEPAAAADKRALVRRAYFDLIGLPPTPQEVQAFLDDHSPKAFEQLVDRLLDSPHFGERWGRHWLDLVRYAESRGHEFDYDIPNAHHYRDYVIRALNADLPYDQLLREHLAGDLLENPRRHPTEGFNESVLGTGFWFLGEWVHSPVDIRHDETDRFDNMVDVFSKTFLGLTVSCARCHDHKFDAISQKDYYALFGFLQSSGYRQVRFDSMLHNEQIARELEAARQAARPEIGQAVAQAQRPVVQRLAKYLLAAHDVGVDQMVLTNDGGPEEAQAEFLSEPSRARIRQAAETHGVDAEVLARWVVHLLAARSRPDDPLHGWARLTEQPEAAGSDARLTQIVEPLVQSWQARADKADGALEEATLIVDYARPGPEDWHPDGVSFGLGPVRPGQMLLGDDPARPIDQVMTYGAVRRDPVWNGLRLASGTALESGKLNKLRAGRTFRTGTFQLESGVVHYLVRGAAMAYAAVDSHALIHGPLHGALVKQWEAHPEGRARWVSHDLRRYQGHRTHLEFTAVDDQPLEVLMVVQAERAPGDPLDRPNALLLDLLRDQAGTLDELAAGYQRLLVETNERLSADQLAASPHAADQAELANWMLQHPGLFGLQEEAVREPITRAAGAYRSQAEELAGRIRHESRTAPAMLEGSGVDELLLIRGNPKTVGDPVPRRLLEGITGADQPPIDQGSGRLELAGRVLDPSNPFTSRVMANRIWHHLFGRGLAASVDNFGVLGQPPTHPELLDYLAQQFVQEGWSIKRLIRSVMLSSTYQMSSRPDPRAERLDPENLLLQHMPIRRLQGEVIRDAILAVSGRLDPTMFGPSVPVHLTPFMQGRGRPGSGPLDGNGRRSIYLSVRRNFLSPMMLAFDMPIPFTSIGNRNVSNVPAQALILMNNPLVVQQARQWAERTLAVPDQTPGQRIDALYRTALARPPSDGELAAALDFLGIQARELGLADDQTPHDPRVWADLAHVLLNSKEFIYLD